MELTGEQAIAAPREEVWRALNDAEILARCIPGCESLKMTSDTEFDAVVTVKMGPVKAKFSGNVTLSDLDPPNGYTLTGEGKGGAAGFAKGQAVISLSERDGGTLLTYKVSAQVGGKIAQLGARLLDGTSRKLAGEFFASFGETFAGPAEVAPEAPAEAPTEALAEVPDEGGLSPAVWAAGLILVVVLLLLFYGL